MLKTLLLASLASTGLVLLSPSVSHACSCLGASLVWPEDGQMASDGIFIMNVHEASTDTPLPFSLLDADGADVPIEVIKVVGSSVVCEPDHAFIKPTEALVDGATYTVVYGGESWPPREDILTVGSASTDEATSTEPTIDVALVTRPEATTSTSCEEPVGTHFANVTLDGLGQDGAQVASLRSEHASGIHEVSVLIKPTETTLSAELATLATDEGCVTVEIFNRTGTLTFEETVCHDAWETTDPVDEDPAAQNSDTDGDASCSGASGGTGGSTFPIALCVALLALVGRRARLHA